ncbi:efflux RND transporter periplasmic adaptor subunit [Desulfonatronovibrio magnus]|uniref:efflux RND transporter periplasmic adaptor subunit n=1 Tax=Desulfonatronovibrio magnus TaxID=698827 RepID=UPI0005EBADCA|nr:efflux RND transporter periplasmic adaptor subunit [Desulfonatronovibrio magnus]
MDNSNLPVSINHSPSNVKKHFLIIGAILLIAFAGGFVSKQMSPPPHAENQETAYNHNIKLAQDDTSHSTDEQPAMQSPPSSSAIFTEITGIVEYISPGLVETGSVQKGELLIKLNTRQYIIARQQAIIDASQLESRLAHLERRALAERQEWYRFQTRRYFEPDPMTQYEPALSQLRHDLARIYSHIEQLDYHLTRSEVHAPFNAEVMEIKTGIGQRVDPYQPFAVIRERVS